MRDLSERFESFTNGLKNLAIVIGSFAIIIFIWPSISDVIEGRKNIESFEAFGVGVSLTEAVNKASRQEGTIDQEVPEPIATAAEKIEVGGELWSFVGTYKEGYASPNFNISNVPKVGDEIVAINDTYRRAREPRFTITGWRMGEIEGLIKSNQILRVKEVSRIPAKGSGYQDWVKGTILKSPNE